MRVYVPPGSRASGERSRDPSSLLLLLGIKDAVGRIWGSAGYAGRRVGAVLCCAVYCVRSCDAQGMSCSGQQTVLVLDGCPLTRHHH
jgi:hypothetical protein